MNEQAIDIVIRAKDEATKALQKIQGTAKNLSWTLEKVGKVSAVAFWALMIAVNNGKQAIDEDAEATNRLTKLLKTASKATDDQVSSLIAQAEALEKSTVAWYDMIATTQSQLATFNLQASTIEKLTPAILDYVVAEKGASASAEEYRSMTQWLAQALNGNFASLTKSGFILDEHTKHLIKNGTEAEKAEAIYNVLQSTYKGFATDATQTAIGKQIQLNKALEDVNKLVASALIPIIDELKLRVLLIAQAVLEWTEKHPELTKNLILGAVAVAWLGSAMLVIMPILSGVWTAITAWIVVVKALGVALTFLAANPVWIIITALAALGLALYYVWKNWDEIKVNLVLVWEQIKRDISSIVDWLKEYIFWVFDAIGNFVMDKIDFLKNKAKEAADYLKSIYASYESSKVWQAVSNLWGAVYDATHGERAVWWSVTSWQPYLVWERWPEIVIPKSASTVVPNNQIGWGANISINFGGVTVRSDSDIQALARTIEDSLTRKMQLYQKWIA